MFEEMTAAVTAATNKQKPVAPEVPANGNGKDEAFESIAFVMKQQTDILERMEKERTKTPANFGTATELHGAGSLFGSHSIEREVITAHIRPFGLGSRLPKIPTVFVQPFFASITGFLADTGSEAATPCYDAPYTHMKGCDLTAQFGRVSRDTKTIEINDVMLRKNRGDFTDLVLMGKLLGESGFTPEGLTEADVLNLMTKSEMITAAISLERKLADHLWNGSPANNNVGGGYKEFPGLTNQIATGQLDAHDNVACGALDSDVKDFTYCGVCGAAAFGTGFTKDIVEFMSMLEAFIYFNADKMGHLPATWVFVMRPELWYVLSDCWPCAYNTTHCHVTDTTAIDTVPSIDSAAMTRVRDDMRNGMYIDVNGRRYPVILDSFISENNNINNSGLGIGQYSSSIFFVPMTIQGGFPVTYIEHVDYTKASADTALLRGTEEFWTDDGKYFWAIEHVKWCYKLSVKSEQRVVLRTPQLAGRIDNVMYEPLQHFRETDPDSPYWADGGVSVRGDETTYAVWK